MSSYQYIRHFVNERLAAAAEEIAGVFINTIVEYEEEIGRQRRLLDSIRTPRIKLQLLDREEQGQQQEVLTGLDQEEPPQIKEEPCTSRDGGEVELKQERDTFPLICQGSCDRDNPTLDRSPGESRSRAEESDSENEPRLHSSEVDGSRDDKAAGCGESGWRTHEEAKLKRNKTNSLDLQEQDISKPQEFLTRCEWSNVDQEDAAPPQIKEEPSTSHDGEQPEMENLMYFPVCRESSHAEDGILDNATNADNKLKHSSYSPYAHTRIRKGEKRCVCSLCGKRFYNKTTLRLHIMSHTGEKPYACDICGNRFTVIAMLNRHMKIHTGEKPYPCGHCEKRFSDKTALRVHMRTHTGEKPYPCDMCEKRLSSATALKVHMRTHTGEKPFCCNTCGGTFRAKTALKSHMRIHTGDKPYTCDFCDKRLSSTTALKVHLRTHTGEKPYPCGMCEKRLSSTTALKIHMRTHTGEKPFSCNTCGSRFRAKATLKIHMRIHTGEATPL
ncbi:zinc finger protein 12-like [Dunckerocampus dactyliophorus]|uniref:zinc finger protein 12-like n=1 Tax=Dunckerocampus dactyliophorus TaxID=161453 RepID=UPI00240641ED|nr:zinc finger protein 12-like [Dunckerocampus dactyliophorus]